MPIKNIKAFSLEANTGGSVDPVRNNIQSFWTYDGSELVYDIRNKYDPSTKKADTSYKFEFSKHTFERNSMSLDDDTEIKSTTYIEELEITPRYLTGIAGAIGGLGGSGREEGSAVDPEKLFDNYIENSIIPSLGAQYRDYKLDLDAPIEYVSNVDNDSVIAGTVNYTYTYGLGSYENAVTNGNISESDLYNFYTFRRRASTGTFLTNINQEIVEPILSNSPSSRKNIQDFFMNSNGFGRALILQEKRESFPFYNEVYFTNPADKLEKDIFKEALKESGLLIAFCDLMNREDFKYSQDNTIPSVIENLGFTNSYLSSSYENPQQTSFKESPAIKQENIKLYDGLKMLKIMHDALPTLPISGTPARAGTPVNTATLRAKGFLTNGEQADYRLDTISTKKLSSNISIDYENALNDVSEAINELLANTKNYRSYKEILEGKKSLYTSDILFYRIAKFEEGSNTPIQNFWIPAEKGYRGIRYIDTQVKYGKYYRYEISAFKFVIGSEYEFVEKDSGVINFGEDLAEFIKGSEKNLEDLIGISLIRPVIQQTADEYSAVLPPELGFGTINVDELTAVSIADFIEERNIISSNLVEVNNYSRISLFANSIDLLGVGTYRGVKISQDNLTEEELQKLETIRQSWACLTNTNKSDPNKLAEIEILLNKVVALGNIREKIVERYEIVAGRKEKWKKFWKTFALTLGTILVAAGTVGIGLGVIAGVAAPALAVAGIIGGAAGAVSGVSAILGASLGGSSKRVNSTGLTPADLTKSDLENLYADISTLTSVSRAPLSIGADDRYWIDLNNPVTFNGADPDLSEEFTKIGRREVLPLFKFDDKGEDESNDDFKERKRYHIELIESTFELRANQLTTLVNEYLGCYQDFIEAASDFNVVLDYKRINKYTLTVKTKPTIKLAELPYYQSEGRILDNPPIYPNINVVTYRGISDKLSFFMNSGQGAIETNPITFSDAEAEFIRQFRQSRKLNDFQPILYKSDETENLGTVFEIRRLSTPPESYEAFRNARVSTTTKTIPTGKNLPAATFDELLNSNTKYYYVFRVADRRGTISYPSGVMEIEIVENSGIIYPLIKPYEFPEQKTETTKNMKRLLNIIPRITQVFPPSDSSTYKGLSSGPTTVLGRESEKLFGKQFKLRLTSKKTGKTVDLNLSFKANVIESAIITE